MLYDQWSCVCDWDQFLVLSWLLVRTLQTSHIDGGRLWPVSGVPRSVAGADQSEAGPAAVRPIRGPHPLPLQTPDVWCLATGRWSACYSKYIAGVASNSGHWATLTDGSITWQISSLEPKYTLKTQKGLVLWQKHRFAERIIDDLCQFCPPMLCLKQANASPDLRGQRLKVQLGLRKRGEGACQSFCQVSARGKNYINQFISRLGQMHL